MATMSRIVANRVKELAEDAAQSYAWEKEPLDDLYPRFEREVTNLAGTEIRIDDTGYYHVSASEAELKMIAKEAWDKTYG